MNAFDVFLTDSLTHFKPAGRVLTPLRASITPNQILIHHTRVPIEKGDVLQRYRPNGKTEEFLVEQSNYYAGVQGVMDPYYVVKYTQGDQTAAVKPKVDCRPPITPQRKIQSDRISRQFFGARLLEWMVRTFVRVEA
jgi:hypothetical protein